MPISFLRVLRCRLSGQRQGSAGALDRQSRVRLSTSILKEFEKLKIYTTRPDTLFGVTFMVIAPEHPIIDKYADKITIWMRSVIPYMNAKKTEFERTQLVKDKTGVRIEGLRR